MNLPTRVEISHSTELDKWIVQNHYLHSAPAGAKLRLWILNAQGNRIGAMMWGRPTARNLDQDILMELTRMYMVDNTDCNAESIALKLARSHIRKHFPNIKGLIAYSSTGQGHKGTIYLADNWFSLGKTTQKNNGWENRPGRETKDSSEKIRWVRTP